MVCSKVQVHREKFLLTHIFLSQSRRVNRNKKKRKKKKEKGKKKKKDRKKKRKKEEKIQSARDCNLHLFVKLLEVPWEFSFNVKFIQGNKEKEKEREKGDRENDGVLGRLENNFEYVNPFWLHAHYCVSVKRNERRDDTTLAVSVTNKPRRD